MNFALLGTSDFKYFFWLIAVIFVFISRIFQLYAIVIYLKPNILRLYVFVLTSMMFITNLPALGIGNPRYRSDSETVFLIIGALGISSFFKKRGK